jgi:hypothetical protein
VRSAGPRRPLAAMTVDESFRVKGGVRSALAICDGSHSCRAVRKESAAPVEVVPGWFSA